MVGHAGIKGYVSRMVNLTILDDRLPNHITLFDLAVDPPALWDEQRGESRTLRWRYHLSSTYP